MKIYDITPIGKPRMTRADKWKQRPAVMRYRAFCDEARLRKIHLPESGAHITFVMPMPQSWSQKKRAKHAGCPHQSKPDCDNMLKALMDALYDARLGLPHHQNMGREGADHHRGVCGMTREEIARYQEESVKRASMPPVAKHNQSQTKTKQPKRAAA